MMAYEMMMAYDEGDFEKISPDGAHHADDFAEWPPCPDCGGAFFECECGYVEK